MFVSAMSKIFHKMGGLFSFYPPRRNRFVLYDSGLPDDFTVPDWFRTYIVENPYRPYDPDAWGFTYTCKTGGDEQDRPPFDGMTINKRFWSRAGLQYSYVPDQDAMPDSVLALLLSLPDTRLLSQLVSQHRLDRARDVPGLKQGQDAAKGKAL